MGTRPAVAMRSAELQGLCGQSHTTMVGMHGGHEDTFLLSLPHCLPSGGEAPGSNFLDNSPDIGQGQGQVTAHDLPWKLQ